MNCVVAAQSQLLGELAGLARQLYVDADERQFAVQRLEVLERLPVGGAGEPGAASCGRERRTTLRVGEDARDSRDVGLPTARSPARILPRRSRA